MCTIHILNGAQPYEFAPGKLNETLAERAKGTFEAQGHEVRLTTVSAAAPKANYGMGGKLAGTYYMISTTLNAPAEAFDDPAEPFFEGMSLYDLLRPVHLNARFFDTTPLPTFGAFDVVKNPDIATDLACFDAHLATIFEELANDAA